jgi:hypothetical protein
MQITLEAIAARREIVQVKADRAQKDLRTAQEELAALDVLERNIKEENTPAPSLTLPGVDIEPPADMPVVSFAQAVRDAVQTLKGMEFTIVDIEDVLRRMRRPLPANSLRTRITLELTPLVNKGVIVRTHSGIGKTPNRYKLVDQGKGEGAERISVHVPLNFNQH